MSTSFWSWLPGGRWSSVTLDGFLHPAFEPVAAALRQQLWLYPGGAAACVYHRGECVVDIWGGVRNAEGEPWGRDTLSPSFSTTKGVAATALHVLVDKGLLDYDDRVAQHWPEFAQEGKEEITVRQVLAHQSGLYHIRQMIDHADRMLDWEHMVRAIERTRPIHPPGEKTGYHGLTFGFLVGELIQRVSGKSFSEVVRTEIAEPLGLDGLYIGAPEEALARAADLMWRRPRIPMPRLAFGETGGRTGRALAAGVAAYEGVLSAFGVDFELSSVLDALAPRGIGSFDFSANETLRATIPAANGLFTARSLARLYAALARGGEIDGVRLLSSGTLERATRVQGRTASRLVIPLDMRWRLGYHGVPTTWGIPRNAFGHFGFGGSGAWADPGRDLAVALIVNSGMGTPFGDARIAIIGGAALASVRARRRPRA
jgi:CubicO group peptidase (beta-lactamase class C family)